MSEVLSGDFSRWRHSLCAGAIAWCSRVYRADFELVLRRRTAYQLGRLYNGGLFESLAKFKFDHMNSEGGCKTASGGGILFTADILAGNAFSLYHDITALWS